MTGDGEFRERIPLWAVLAALVVTVVGSLVILPFVIRDQGPYYLAGLHQHVLAYIALRALVMTLVIWGAFYAVALRGTGQVDSGVVFYLLFFVMIVAIDYGGLASSYTGSSSPQSDAALVMTPEDRLRVALNDSSVALGDFVSPHGRVIMINTSGADAAGQFGDATKKFINALRQAHENENEEFAAADFPNFLLPARLSADRDFATAHAKLNLLRAAKRDLGPALDEAIASYRAWIAGAAMDAPIKQQALANLDRAAAQEKLFRAQEDANSAVIFGESEALLRGLAHPRAPWRVQGNRLLFTTAGDLAAYRRHVAAINAAIGQARALNEGR
jgi:hypothetical protein